VASQKSMQVTIPATQAQRKFGDVIRRVFSGQEHFVVEKDGLPVMAIISMQEYDEFMKEPEERDRRRREFRDLVRPFGEELERRGITEEQMMEDMEKTREKVYRKHCGNIQKVTNSG
jgi:prevent-host-death family protein